MLPAIAFLFLHMSCAQAIRCQGGSPLDSTVPLLPSLVEHHYQLTWHDEFNHRPGYHLPPSERWIADIGHSYPGGAPAWGNNETQKYTTSPANIQVTSSGTLTLTPRLSLNGSWTPARIETQRSDFAATPGGKLYIESRLRTGCAHPYKQQGIWAAFWALGTEFRGNHTNWPAASEWDFVEVVNGLPKVYNTVHCGIAPGGPCNETNGLGNGGVGWSICEWHTVGFEVDRAVDVWYKERLKWYLDGEQVFGLPASRINSSATWDAIAHKGHFLLVNVAVGGYWPGQPNATTADGEDVQMEVDYVRIWNAYEPGVHHIATNQSKKVDSGAPKT